MQIKDWLIDIIFNQRSVYGCSDVGERISETFLEGDNSVKSLYKGQL